MEYVNGSVSGFVKTVTGLLAGAGCALWGASDGWLSALLLFMALDYVSGVTAACIRQELSSRVGFTGLLKKVMILLLAALANTMDLQLGAGGVLRSMVFGFYTANEGISLTENAARCGIRVPKALLQVLQQLQKEEAEDE